MIRRIAAGLLFAVLLAGGIRPSILRLLASPHRPPDVPAPPGAIDRKPLRFANDPVEPDVLRFFERLRSETRPGEHVALMLAPPYDGWSYAHWRGAYVLAGRHVIPPLALVAPKRPPDVVAVWKTGWGHPDYEIQWADQQAAMLRRRP